MILQDDTNLPWVERLGFGLAALLANFGSAPVRTRLAALPIFLALATIGAGGLCILAAIDLARFRGARSAPRRSPCAVLRGVARRVELERD